MANAKDHRVNEKDAIGLQKMEPMDYPLSHFDNGRSLTRKVYVVVLVELTGNSLEITALIFTSMRCKLMNESQKSPSIYFL